MMETKIKSRKWMIYLFVILLMPLFTISAAFDYTSGTVVTNCVIQSGYNKENLIDGSYVADTTGVFFTTGNGNSCQLNITYAEDYDFHGFEVFYLDDGSGSDNDCTVDVSIDGSACGTKVEFDGVTALYENKTCEETGSLMTLNITFLGAFKQAYWIELIPNATEIVAGTGTTPSVVWNTELTSDYLTNLSTQEWAFNLTLTNLSENFVQCYMYQNNTLNYTFPSDAWGGMFLNASSPNEFNLTYGQEEAGYDINLTCYSYLDGDGGAYSVEFNTVFTDVFMDSVPPPVTINSDFLDESVFYENFSETLSFNITSIDTNNYALNVTLRQINKTDGTLLTILNNTYVYDINSTEYTINYTDWMNTSIDMDARDFEVGGRFEILAEGWDDHTKKEIPDYDIIEHNYTYLGTYYTGFMYEGLVSIVSEDIKDKSTVKALSKDKYIFSFDYNNKDEWHDILLYCGQKLVYRQQSDYNLHFICGDKWVDFVSDSIGDQSVQYVGENLAIVSIYNTDKKVDFESIGDLNYNVESWQFNYTAPFKVYLKDSISNSTITDFTVRINESGIITQTLTGTGGVAYYNATSGTYNMTLSATNYISQENETEITYGGEVTYYLTASESLYFFVYDEQTDELIDDRNVSIEVVNYANSSALYITSTGTTFQSSFSPGAYEIRYWAEGYQHRLYFTDILGSDTQIINLYLLNESEGEVKLTEVVDENGEGISNTTVKMLRHFIDCNCFEVVEMSKTDDAGNTFVFGELYDSPYKFYVDYNGVNYLMTDVIRLDSRTLYFKINLGTSGLENYWMAIESTTDLSANKTTNIWEYEWDGASITSANLVVTRETLTGKEVIYNTTVTAPTGSISFNQSAYEDMDGEFIGEGSVIIGNEFITTNRISMTYKDTALTFGLTGLFMVMIVLLVFVGIGISNPTVGISLLLIGLVVVNIAGFIVLEKVVFVGIIVVGLLIIALMKI